MTPGVAAARPAYVFTEDSRALLSGWLFIVAFLVVVMVAVGGATRLTDSGLSITEWQPLLGAIPPLSDQDWADAFEKYKEIPQYQIVNAGMSLAAFKEIYWWEWAHRFLGRFIGLVYAIPLCAFWVAGRVPSRLQFPLLMVLALGGLQGFVGWYMVQSGLTERIDVSQYRLAMHLGLAFIILGCVIWLALTVRSRDPMTRLQPVSAAARWSAGILLGLIFLQVVLGAFVAGTKAGLTYNTWPLMDGELIPSGLMSLSPWYLNIVENVTAIQFNHRMMAYALITLAIVHAILLSRGTENGPALQSGWLLAILMVSQAALGIWTLLAAQGAIPIYLGVAHQTAAAVLLAVAVWHLHTVHRAVRS